MKKHLLFFLCLTLFGCGPLTPLTQKTPTPTVLSDPPAAAPVNTAAPAATPTLTPLPPLTAHEWMPKTVLLRLDLTLEKNEILHPQPPPQFILYADGTLIITRPAIEGVPHRSQQLLVKKLQQTEICRILNTLDRTGFMDYDPESYAADSARKNTNARIEVNAWKSHAREYAGLPFALFSKLTGLKSAAGEDIPPALQNAYYLTADYPEDGFEIYEPEVMAVWVRPLTPAEVSDVTWEDWRFPPLTISYLYSKIGAANGNVHQHYAALRKQGALNLYEYLRESFATNYYIETNKLGEKSYYAVYARPLLPYELPGTYEMQAPAPFPPLTCAPADGILAIPEPSSIYQIPLP